MGGRSAGRGREPGGGDRSADAPARSFARNSARSAPSGAARGRFVYRHRALVRITHWINVPCLAVLLMSGLQIFNAHPALYWGENSDPGHQIVSIEAADDDAGGQVGITRVLGRSFVTTGVLGLSVYDSAPAERAFPGWITLPGGSSLAAGRVFHFFFGWLFVLNGAVYVAHTLANGHLARDLVPGLAELRTAGRTLKDHLRLRFARRPHYNVLQKLAYLASVFGLVPVCVLAGLTMSPGLDAAWPWLVDLFGGRQSARTIHFLAAALLVGFALVHVLAVILSGFFHNMRAMITGWYWLPPQGPRHDGA